MRTIIISDIHGCRETFEKLLNDIGFDKKTNQLVLLGDLMDWGPDPCGTYIAVRSLKEEMEDRCVLIRGDHDQMCLDAELLTRGQIANGLIWKQNGGKETLKSFKDRGMSCAKAAVWLNGATRTWFEDQDFIAVHGDIRDEVVWNNTTETFLWGNEGVTENNYSGKLAVVGHTEVPSPTYLDGSGRPSNFHPQYGVWFELPKRGMVALDTGCGNGGKLTAMIIENGWMRFECAVDARQ